MSQNDRFNILEEELNILISSRLTTRNSTNIRQKLDNLAYDQRIPFATDIFYFFSVKIVYLNKRLQTINNSFFSIFVTINFWNNRSQKRTIAKERIWKRLQLRFFFFEFIKIAFTRERTLMLLFASFSSHSWKIQSTTL